MRRRASLGEKYDPPELSFDEGLEDEEAFRQAMSEVEPLKPGPKRIRRKPESNGARPSQEFLNDLDVMKAFMSEMDFDWSFSPDYIEGGRRDWNRPLLEKLRRGGFSVQAELDLHGLSQSEAQEELERFIRSCVRDRLTCVRVVHGKGKHSLKRDPILKERLQQWFRRRKLGRYVVAYSSARPSDGGVGAVYVLLAKPK